MKTSSPTAKTKKIVSACLAGLHCRYDCASKEQESIKLMVQNGEAIALCPEQMGGLSTPRSPAEIVGDKVLTIEGRDVTDNFKLGAEEALMIAKLAGATEAHLKSRSPMCGNDKIYDGTFTGKLTKGDGVFSKLLKKHGIKIVSVD